MSKVFRRKIFSHYLGEQRAIDDIISQFIPDPSSTPLPVTPTPTPSITPTLTPSVTPSLTPSITPSLTPTISVTPSLTPTITPSAQFFIYDAQDCNDPFAAPVVVKSTSFLLIGSSVKVVGDSNTCYEILNTGFPPEDFIVDTTYTDCFDCNITITPTPTPTSTVTPTPTPTSTVTPTPTPSPTFIYYDAQDCNDPFANPVVVRSSSVLLIGSSVKVIGDAGTCYEILNNGFAPHDFIVDTTYTDCIDCNITITPTPTPTLTQTPTITPTKTPTPTPTLTPTPTSSAVPAIPVLLYLDAAEPSSYPGSGDTWFDISGNGNDAALDNSPTFVSNGIESYFSFSGDTNYADISGFTVTNNSSLVIMMTWYGPNTGLYNRIWSTGPNDNFEIGVNNAGSISNYISSGWRNNTTSFGGIGICRHFVFTFNGPELKVYRDGILVNTTNIGSPLTPGDTTSVARRYKFELGWEGTIIDTKYIKVYDGVLDATQVLNEYNNNSLRC
jgi:hypothetical protein